MLPTYYGDYPLSCAFFYCWEFFRKVKENRGQSWVSSNSKLFFPVKNQQQITIIRSPLVLCRYAVLSQLEVKKHCKQCHRLIHNLPPDREATQPQFEKKPMMLYRYTLNFLSAVESYNEEQTLL